MGAAASMGWDGRAGERPLALRRWFSLGCSRERNARDRGAAQTNARGNSIRAFLASPLRIWIPREEDTFQPPPHQAYATRASVCVCVFIFHLLYIYQIINARAEDVPRVTSHRAAASLYSTILKTRTRARALFTRPRRHRNGPPVARAAWHFGAAGPRGLFGPRGWVSLVRGTARRRGGAA